MAVPLDSGKAPDALGRREFVQRSLAAGTALVAPQLAGAGAPAAGARPGPAARQAAQRDDILFEKSIAELHTEMDRGALSSQAITQRYLARITEMDKQGPAINAVIELNPDALMTAEQRDAERRAGGVRGPLHGIPVLIKDNIDSADRMRTSAGSLALATSTPPKDAFIVERLRQAGAVLLGKTNLSEWANFRSTRSTSGWSGRGGLTRNPYVLDRNPCGSSSGTGAAIASDFATVGIGTETDGSIICPSSICGLVGIKPTVGLWSRSGIIPISRSQDTAGPMARSVADAAALLGALTGVDPRDAATKASAGKSVADYTRFLDRGGLKGARIGVARNLAGFNTDVDAIFENAIAALNDAGAEVVDKTSLLTAGKFDDAETIVLDYEFKAGLNSYLASLGQAAPVKTLLELIAWNDRAKEREMPWFGQEIFVRAQKRGPLTDKKYLAARAKCVRLARTQGIDALMTKHGLDAVICPSNQPAWTTDLLNGDHFTGGNTSFAAVAGYPSVTVPMGLVHDLPVGLSFVGRAWSEGQLIKYAYAFEQQVRARRPPRYLTTLAG
ncbi:MAG TPA: amidase [Gemmatimonadaceae bacterium]|nr:amidase [Gemmatimonadaceae bacterium]